MLLRDRYCAEARTTHKTLIGNCEAPQQFSTTVRARFSPELMGPQGPVGAKLGAANAAIIQKLLAPVRGGVGLRVALVGARVER